MTFDRFPVMKLLSEAVDDIRRVEQRDNPLLKKTRYIWLKNEPNLTAKQQETRAWLTRPSMRLATARALRWREDFQAFYDQPPVSYTHLRAHETPEHLVCRLLLEKKNQKKTNTNH